MKLFFKTIFFCASAILIWFVNGCTEVPDPLDRNIYIEILEISDNAEIDYDAESGVPTITVPAKGGSFSLRVSSALTWNAATAQITTDSDGNATEDTAITWMTTITEEDILSVTVDIYTYADSDDVDISSVLRDGVVKLQIGNDPRAKVYVKQGAVSRATVGIGTTSVSMPSSGDSLEYEVITNQSEFTAELVADVDNVVADWITIDVTTKPGYLILTSPRNDSGSARSTNIILTAGEGDNIAQTTVIITQSNGNMVLTYVVESSNTVALPICGTVDCTIDWGDGDSETVGRTINPDTDSDFIRHTYTYDGTYSVTITGSVERLRSAGMSESEKSKLTGVGQWGNIGLKSLNEAFAGTAVRSFAAMADNAFAEVTDVTRMFYGCASLTSVPGDLFNDCVTITEFTSVFEGCENLTTVNSAIFSNCAAATSFTRTFALCAKLKTLNEALFAGNTNVLSFTETFYGCDFLESIPANLFTSNTKVTSFNNTFENCLSLSKVLAGLFKNNKSVTSFSGTFKGCINLTSVATNVFVNCLKVTDFSDLFNGCVSLAGKSPYNVAANKDDVQLYKRKDYPTEFTTPTSYSGAFRGCVNLNDYETISASYSDWL